MILSSTMRDVLIEHLDGTVVPWLRSGRAENDLIRACHRQRTLEVLVERGWLKPCREDGGAEGPPMARPAFTKITEAGREQLCRLLSEYAELLIRLGICQSARASGQIDVYSILKGPPIRASQGRDNP